MTIFDPHREIVHTVNALVTKEDGGSHLVLLEHRSDGSWVFPGNARPVATPDLLASLARDLQHELGLTPDSYTVTEVDIRESFRYEHPGQTELFGKDGILHLFLVEYNGSEPIVPGRDVLETGWVEPDDVAPKLTYDSSRRAFLRAVEYL